MPAISQRIPSGRLHKRFCANVRFWRKELELTQIEAAKRCKMTQSQYCEIETGKFVPVLETADRIAKAFGIDPAELFADREPVAA